MLVVGFFPLSFSAVYASSQVVNLAYLFTESAGKYGTVVIVIITSYCYTIRVESKRKKLGTFIKSVVAVSAFIGILAFINEHLTKPVLREVRPSHNYIIGQLHLNHQLDSVYQLSKNDRQQYFEQLINNNQQLFNKIDAKVLAHWKEEAGYSFPSGHSFNAYLLATIMAFSLYHATNKKWNKYYWIPFMWACLVATSRVAIGAHSSLDVVAGSLAGFIIASIFIYFDTTRKLLIHKKY
jgi:phosphatidylglycerophosphatase B